MQVDEHDYGIGSSKAVNGNGNGHANKQLATASSKGKQRQGVDWPGAIRTLINTVFEDTDLEEAYTIIIQNSGQSHRPNADTVLQLVALALEPDSCLPQRRTEDNHDHDDGGADLFTHDPYALTSRHASSKAIALLRRWLYLPGPARVLAALPRRADPKNAPPRTTCTFLNDEEMHLKPIQVMARRITHCHDIWNLLSRKLSEEDIVTTSSRARADAASQTSKGLSDLAWDFLKLLVEAWTRESQLPGEDSDEPLGHSPSLLSQFKESMIGGMPSDFDSCIEIIFQPFANDHMDNMKRPEHAETALELLSLLSTLVETHMIEKAAFLATFGASLAQLQASNFQELVTSCLPNQPLAKVELLNSYLSKYGAPATFTLPPRKSKTPSPTPLSPVKTEKSAPKSSSPVKKQSVTPSLSQQDAIMISSGSDSDDSDIVCLTPTVKKSSPVKSTPTKAKPAALASPKKQDSLLSVQGSQDVKPDASPIVDPMLAKPSIIIEKMSKQFPREIVSLSPDAPKPSRLQSRPGQRTNSNPKSSGISSSVISAEIKFAAVKLELCRIYISYAESKKAEAVLAEWKSIAEKTLLDDGIRNARHVFEWKEDDEELKLRLEKWQLREQTVVESLF